MTTNYERGRKFEYRVRDKLKELGAVEVIRSAGSHTKVDLVALFPGDVRLIQCKHHGRLPKQEREVLIELSGEWPYMSAWLARQGARGEGVVLERLEKEAA